MSVRRQLTEDDLIDMATDPAPKVAPPIIQKLRASHHTAARLLAQGKPVKEVAILVGRTPQRISDLQKDPAFTNLVTYYHEQVIDTTLDQAQTLQETWIDIAQLATDEIVDRLEDPEQLKVIPVGELRQLATAGSDRTVAPPRQAAPLAAPPMQVTFNMGTSNLRPAEDKTEQMIDVTPKTETESEEPS
jgi:hypothetical protein